ncbi:MAG: HDIG domain-containing protein [Eubacteriales bacterium]|nr:HDIG domain-containing protein [Eubacteriales bacterium]
MFELPVSPKAQKPSFRKKAAERLGSQAFVRLLAILAGGFLCLLLFFVSISPKRYNLTVGMVPDQTIAAHKDVIDEVTTKANRDTAAAAVAPTYHYQSGITEAVIGNLEAAHADMVAARQYAQTLSDFSSRRTYSQDELASAHDMLSLVELQDFQLVTLLNASNEQFDEMYSALVPAVRNTMQGNVIQGQESSAINSIMQLVGYKTNVSLLQNVVLPVLREIIQPNMVVDGEATEAARQDAWEAVEPVVFKQGQNIVVRGEGRVRENQIAMLNSLGLLDDNTVDYAMYLGGFGLVAFMLTLAFAALKGLSPSVAGETRSVILINLVLIISLALSLLAKEIQLIYLAPLALPFMLLTATISSIPAIIAGSACTALSAIMLTGTGTGSATSDWVNLLSIGIFSGVLSSLMLKSNYQRSFVLLTGTLVGLANFLLLFAIGLLTSMNLQSTVTKGLWSLVGAAVSTVLCLAIQPALESAFNLPTPTRLLDLTNPNHPLLRRLLLEAPGTYHHSIIIANLAEASAEAIGANPLLARAGAYFHDIGKLKRPLYFKENQIGTGNVHDSTNPQVSAAIITSHVREGIAMARQYRLPHEIQQIIAEHHGDSLVAFFYHKAVQESANEQLDDEEFRYAGVPPRTIESALVMLCDTIEAAIRTLNNPSQGEIVDFIDSLIHKKIQSCQLHNAPLTLKDLQIISNTCATVLNGVFHERIEYPAAPDKLAPRDKLMAQLQQFRKSTTPQSRQPEEPVQESGQV